MKKRYKFLIFFVVLIGAFVSFYFYQLNKYMKLNDTDRTIILKSFGKDSDGKGYSDEGHLMMMNDLNQLKGQIPDEKLKEFEFFYKQSMISRRTSLLSKNSEEFILNETLSNKIINCWADFYETFPKSFKEKNRVFFFDRMGFGEKQEFNDYADILFEKYTRNMSSMEKNDLINIRPLDGECDLFLKGKNE